jgi:tetratricopeptide (TPR) repeat protein
MKRHFRHILLFVIVQPCLLSFVLSQTAYKYSQDAYAMMSAKDYDSSIILFTKAIQLDSTIANYFINRGYAKASLDKFQQATEDFIAALKIDSNSSIAYYDMACMYSIQGMAAKAFLYLDKAYEKGFEAYHDFIHAVKTDPNFDFLRKQKEYPAFVKKYSVIH